MTPLKTNLDFRTCSVSGNDKTPFRRACSIDVGLFLQGRAWSAAELRRKSFRDLHTLWYVLLRERNLIATQMETYRRASVPFGVLGNVEKRAYQVRLRVLVSLSLDPILTSFLSLVSQEHGANKVCD